MILKYLLPLLFLAAPAAAQVVTSPVKLVSKNADGSIMLATAHNRVTPPLPRNTVVFACGEKDGLFVLAVRGTECPKIEKDTPLFGINLSGAEAKFGDALRPKMADWQNNIDRLGFQLIRYPFKRERMTTAKIVELQKGVEFARSRGVPVILDNHSFNWPPVDDQVAWWTAFAKQFPDDGTVLLDLNNEPKGVSWTQWGIDAKLIIAALRKNGINHPILLEWPGYSGISRFDKNERSTKVCESAMCALNRAPGVLDPINRTFMNGHRYFDSNGSGTNAACQVKVNGKLVTRTSSGFASFASQLRKYGLKGYITESAFGNYRGIPASCRQVGVNAIEELRANADVLVGVTWWGGGPTIWPEDYIFKVECKKEERYTCAVPPYTVQLTGR